MHILIRMAVRSTRQATRWTRLAAVVLAGAAALSACSSIQPELTADRMIGAPESQVQATFGPPTDVYQLSDGTTRWFYSRQPLGQQSYAANFDASGNLVSFRQMLVTPELYKAQIGVWTTRDVEEHFGKPREPTQYFPMMKRMVWAYRFRHEDVWPSMFNFYFSDDGILRQTQITPDPLADPRSSRR